MSKNTLSEEEVIAVVYHLLSQIQEGITDFKFHEVKRQSVDFLSVSVGYTWSMNGYKKL